MSNTFKCKKYQFLNFSLSGQVTMIRSVSRILGLLKINALPVSEKREHITLSRYLGISTLPYHQTTNTILTLGCKVQDLFTRPTYHLASNLKLQFTEQSRKLVVLQEDISQGLGINQSLQPDLSSAAFNY